MFRVRDNACVLIGFSFLLHVAIASRIVPEKPVAHNFGQLWLIYDLLWGIVACYFGLLGVPGRAFFCLTCLAHQALASQSQNLQDRCFHPVDSTRGHLQLMEEPQYLAQPILLSSAPTSTQAPTTPAELWVAVKEI